MTCKDQYTAICGIKGTLLTSCVLVNQISASLRRIESERINYEYYMEKLMKSLRIITGEKIWIYGSEDHQHARF